MLNETYRGMLAHKSVIREPFMYGKQRAAEIGYENVFDYSLGNPSVPCPPQFAQALQNLLETEGPVDLALPRQTTWPRPSACPMRRRTSSPRPVPPVPSPTPSAP